MSEAQLVLAQTMYGEARGEGPAGMGAVASVIMNRVRSSVAWWGNTVIEVCKAPWQFSAWNANDPNREMIESMRPGDNATFDVAYQMAGDAIAGDLFDLTGGATHYYNPQYANPDWGDQMANVIRIGNHKFGVA